MGAVFVSGFWHLASGFWPSDLIELTRPAWRHARCFVGAILVDHHEILISRC